MPDYGYGEVDTPKSARKRLRALPPESLPADTSSGDVDASQAFAAEERRRARRAKRRELRKLAEAQEAISNDAVAQKEMTTDFAARSRKCIDDNFDDVMPSACPESEEVAIGVEDSEPVELGTLSQQFCWILWDWLGMNSPLQVLGIILGIVLYIVFSCKELDDAHPLANDMFAITLLVSVFWVFEALPLAVTSLIPAVLIPFHGIMTSAAVSAAYWGWVQMMFIGAFLVDIAIEHVNLHRRFALWVLLKVGLQRPWAVVLAFMSISFVLSTVCSNTATTVMLVPFACGLLDTSVCESGDALMFKRFSAGVLLAVAYGSSCGGIATLIGTATNGVLAGLPIVAASSAVGSFDWFLFAAPVSVGIALVCFGVLYVTSSWGMEIQMDDEEIRSTYESLGRLNRDEVIVATIQVLQLLGFLLRRDVINNPNVTGPADLRGVNDASIACAAALLLFFIPSVTRRGEAVLTWEVAQDRLPWSVLMLMGGGFAIAQGFQQSGLTQIAGRGLAALVGTNRLAQTFYIVLCVCWLTEVTSNTATANIILPILVSVSIETLTHPLALLLPATVACSLAFMLPSATPPNAVVFATKRVHMCDIVRAGFFINILSIAVGTFLIYGMASAIFHVDEPFPKWACSPKYCAWVDVPGNIRGRSVSSQACIMREDGFCSLYDGSLLNSTVYFGANAASN